MRSWEPVSADIPGGRADSQDRMDQNDMLPDSG
jgi:hypothetical protein